MATTDYNAKLDIPFIKEFSKYLPNEGEYKGLRDWINSIPKSEIGSGIIQRDRLMELACAEQSNGQYSVVSKDAYDFSNGDDMKTVTVSKAPSVLKKSKFGAIVVPKVENKIGNLRVVAYDPESEKFRFFIIWEWGTDSTKIYFSADPNSNSKYTNGQCGIELNSFEELASWKEIKLNNFNVRPSLRKLRQYDTPKKVNYQQPIEEIMENIIDFSSQI